MSFDVRLKKSAEKELRKLKVSLFIKIDEIILGLIKDPRPDGALKIQGEDNLFRIRYGDYRIIYEIDDNSKYELQRRKQEEIDTSPNTTLRKSAGFLYNGK